MKSLTKKLLIVALLSFSIAINGHAQTLFTYGNTPVSKEDFVKAYSKNNNEGKPTEKSYKDYLELYIRYKLKVKAAYDLKLDTLPGQKTELKNFRNQVADSYMNDEESLNALINEAYDRSRKDIHLAHIFVAAPKTATPADTLKAFEAAAFALTKDGGNKQACSQQFRISYH